jgi:hypothetical protein
MSTALGMLLMIMPSAVFGFSGYVLVTRRP